MTTTTTTTDPLAPLPQTNDGGIVLCLSGMAVEISVALFACIAVYVHYNQKTTVDTIKLVAAWSNLGSSFVHFLIVLYILANDTTDDSAPFFAFWEKERALGMDGIGGPMFLVIANGLVGMISLQNSWKHNEVVALFWNTFIGVAGIGLPHVWPRFLEEGLGGWPYPLVFLWCAILMMEVTGVFASWTHHFMKKKNGTSDSKTGKDD
jgi:hypothetical protein